MRGMVVAVSRSPTHTLQKPNVANIRLVTGLGVEGDAHLGKTVDTIPIHHPGTWLDAAGDEVLRLDGGGGAAINDIPAGEAWRAKETDAQCQNGADQGLRHGRFPHSRQQLLTRRTMPTVRAGGR